jgi:hypothetical protein
MSYNFDKITAKIFIKKTKFFGLYKKYAVIIILPSLKIAKVKTNIKNFPFTEKEYLSLSELLLFLKIKNFTITYNTNNKILKRLLTILI